MTGPIEKEVAALLPLNPAPQIVAAIREAVREARGLPAEATILRFPTQNRNPE